LHEAFCFDSFQDSLLFWDDFEGDSLKDLWRSTGDAGGSVAVTDAVSGGIVRITTDGDDDDEWYLDWGDIRSLLASKKITFEAYIDLEQITVVNVRFGLYYDATHLIVFDFDTDSDTNWMINTDDGTGPTSADSGITPDTDYHVYRIECFPSGEVSFWIDETQVSNSPLTADIPTEHLQPYFYIQTREASAHYIDVDYVWVRQDR